MAENLALIFSDFSAGHETGRHPENQRRLQAIQDQLQQYGMDKEHVYSAERVALDAVYAVHDSAMVDATREYSMSGGGFLDADTLVSTGSWDAALAASGAAVQATELVLTGRYRNAFSMARPPGHHVESRRQIGFCLFNNVAIAAEHARLHHGLERIAIVDWDVHHGNGTQEIFYSRSDVLFCSVHQWPLFPGSGLEHERGSGEGEGFTINAPLPAGSGDHDVLRVFDDRFGPAIESFEPDLTMVSAGFDAHRDDPLSEMSMSPSGFAQLAGRVSSWADKLCNGRLVLVLEGGYNLRALSESVSSVIAQLSPPE
jgi:acetoin utilization deacetylase AcuC-like enzyme